VLTALCPNNFFETGWSQDLYKLIDIGIKSILASSSDKADEIAFMRIFSDFKNDSTNFRSKELMDKEFLCNFGWYRVPLSSYSAWNDSFGSDIPLTLRRTMNIDRPRSDKLALLVSRDYKGNPWVWSCDCLDRKEEVQAIYFNELQNLGLSSQELATVVASRNRKGLTYLNAMLRWSAPLYKQRGRWVALARHYVEQVSTMKMLSDKQKTDLLRGEKVDPRIRKSLTEGQHEITNMSAQTRPTFVEPDPFAAGKPAIDCLFQNESVLALAEYMEAVLGTSLPDGVKRDILELAVKDRVHMINMDKAHKTYKRVIRTSTLPEAMKKELVDKVWSTEASICLMM
jgi:hypothetical protein